MYIYIYITVPSPFLVVAECDSLATIRSIVRPSVAPVDCGVEPKLNIYVLGAVSDCILTFSVFPRNFWSQQSRLYNDRTIAKKICPFCVDKCRARGAQISGRACRDSRTHMHNRI